MHDWQKLAMHHGWQEINAGPDGESPCLYHNTLNRVWPLNDWYGACLDIGLTEEDFADLPN